MSSTGESESEIFCMVQYNHLLLSEFSQEAKLFLPTILDSQPYMGYSTTCSTSFNLSALSLDILYGFDIFKNFTLLAGNHVEVRVQTKLQHHINVSMLNDSTPNFTSPPNWQRTGNTLTYTGNPSSISPYVFCLSFGFRYDVDSLGIPGSITATYVFPITNVTTTDNLKSTAYRMGLIYNL
jgi:hypothetical protein